MREGDTLVIWKLDRLGRSLTHLVELVKHLEDRQIGLVSLNDPIDTTAQGRLVFRIFASLAEFESDLYENPGKLPVNEIASQLGIAKPTLYTYLRHRGVKIGNEQ